MCLNFFPWIWPWVWFQDFGELSWTVKHHPMPWYQICTIPGCSSRSDRRECEGVKFHRLPQDPDQRYRWLVSIKKPISVSENTRICSLHFERSEGTVKSLIPTIFPWSIPVKLRHPPAIRNPIPPTKRKHEESPTPSKIAKRKIESHRVNCSVGGKSIEEVRTLSNQHFFLKWFEGSDSDLQFYTGLPSYPVFMCLYI